MSRRALALGPGQAVELTVPGARIVVSVNTNGSTIVSRDGSGVHYVDEPGHVFDSPALGSAQLTDAEAPRGDQQ